MMGRRPQCYIPSFMEIGQLVPENIFEVFYHIYERGGHLGHVNQMSRIYFRPPTQIGSTQNLPWIDQAVSEKKIFEILDDGRKTTNRHRIMAIPLWLTC